MAPPLLSLLHYEQPPESIETRITRSSPNRFSWRRREKWLVSFVVIHADASASAPAPASAVVVVASVCVCVCGHASKHDAEHARISRPEILFYLLASPFAADPK